MFVELTLVGAQTPQTEPKIPERLYGDPITSVVAYLVDVLIDLLAGAVVCTGPRPPFCLPSLHQIGLFRRPKC